MRYVPLLLLPLIFAGCSTEYTPEKPSPTWPVHTVAARSNVKTTAYCHLEDGNRSNAIGGRLQYGHSYSASADWSRYPVGTVFRLPDNQRIYVVDDYGSAMIGTDTIDLYVPTLREMNNWGVRRVEIDILQWGSYEKSLAILRPRASHGYVRRMVHSLEDHFQQTPRNPKVHLTPS